MDALRISTRTENGTATVAVIGELDIATAPDLSSHLDGVLLGRHQRILIDLSGVSFIAASGLGLLVTVRLRAERQHTALVLTGLSPTVQRLLKITKLDGHFTTT